MNVNQIVRIIPTLKVNNRKLNETFYIETLGMKALLEESAFLSLGDQTGLEKLVLEEARRSFLSLVALDCSLIPTRWV